MPVLLGDVGDRTGPRLPAARERGLRYSQLIAGLEKIGCELDRRTLAEMAVLDPTGFDAVAAAVRQALGVPEPAAVA